MTTALVTGATGMLGRLLIDRLVAEGVHTRAFARSASSNGFPAGVDKIDGDVRDAAAVRRAAQAVETIFHLAAAVHQPRRPSSDYLQINVEGTANVVAAARDTGARLIHASTISVYGPGRGEVIDETTPCRPEGPYAVTKRDGETVVERLGDRATILRLASVFGPTMKGNYPRLVRAIRRGTFVRPGPGVARKTVVYETDAVRAAMAARLPAAGGRVFNVTDGAVHTIDEIIDAIAGAAGVDPPRLRVPAGWVRSAAAAADAVLHLAGRRGGARASLDKYLEDVAVRGDRIQEQLDFRPAVSLREGWQLSLRDR